MSEQKHFVLIGLGSFGRALAIKLKANGCRVSGIDSSSEHVEDLKDILYEAVIGDATLRESLEPLLLDRATGVFVSMGEDIARSILATLHARELGAKHIMAKGVTKEHGKILKALGVERVVFPEIEIANQIADRLTWPNIIDFLPIDSEYSFVEIAVPAVLTGKTLAEADLRKRFGVWVVGVKDALSGKLTMFPEANFKFNDDQFLLVVGKENEIAKLRKAI
jgi:trk system potassium uptake protein TrkA